MTGFNGQYLTDALFGLEDTVACFQKLLEKSKRQECDQPPALEQAAQQRYDFAEI